MQEKVRIYNREIATCTINDNIIGIIESVEKTKAEIYKHMQELIYYGAVKEELYYDVENWEVSIKDGVIIISIPDTPIIINQYTSASKRNFQRSRWVGNISYALNNLNIQEKLDKVFVYIKYTFPVRCDIDNTFFKPIIDGIRYSGIVRDDTFQSVAIMHNGELTQGFPHTKIYIIPKNNIQIKGLEV